MGEASPANTKNRPNAGSMLGQRLRRCSNIEPTLGQFLVFAGTPIRVAMGSCRWGEEAGVHGSGINSCRDHMSGVPPLTHRRLGTKGRYLPVYWVTHTFISFPGDTGYPCVCSSVSCPGGNTLLWGNKAVSGCFSSKQLLPFAFLYTAE